ncbi:MAG: hypothetical protein VX837_04620 [Candidatus Thermoplasmatota archaeon]|nr:hypothetical protein [Candidatus Thermoplasmatota archaeon]MEE3276724.1 hypothetical protein [Candidatus Thermoplasmatota archaeon]
MEPLTLTDVTYSAFTFRSQRNGYAFMVVVDGFADAEDARAHLESFMPLLTMEASDTLH